MLFFSGEVTKEKVDRFVEVQGGDSPSKVLEIETKSKKKLYIVIGMPEMGIDWEG